MAVEPDRAKSLFMNASDRTDLAERAAYLERECGSDVEMRREVERLLAANAELDMLLEPPPPGPVAPGVNPETDSLVPGVSTVGSGVSATVDVPAAASPSTPRADGVTATFTPGDSNATWTAAPGDRSVGGSIEQGIGALIAGRYTLVGVIGEGGMGSVYLASQSTPVRREVALKLIKTGMDSRGVLARFDAERQALALMDHPNIARIYDGGVTSAGQPFFVMELVKGVPLAEYCDQKRLSVRARLELFVAVCQAVQHAHQKGIIHRDLKPGNVLVTEVDGRPTPKVIDFGVAKATEVKLTDLSFSDVGAIVGTPAYMSPEQADPTSMDIDTRTDVYALGVMLYELLTGSPPIDAKQFQRGAVLEMLRMVREVEPPRPSTKLSTAEALPNIASNRSIDPAKLSKLLQGELDWVVMKALEKDRTRRYDTANGFARDIQRYLADEVVEARPPTRGYRLKKFVKRNKRQVVAASLVFLALVGGIIGTSIGLYQADRARDAEAAQRKIAVHQKKMAEEREELAIDAVKKFRDAVANNPELKDNPALESLRRTLFKEPLSFFRALRISLQAEGDTRPEAMGRLADAAHDYAHITEEIGDREDSLRAHAESLAIWKRLEKSHPNILAVHVGLGSVYFCEGKLLGETGRLAEAGKAYDSAVAIYEKLTAADPGQAYFQQQLALSQMRRGILFGDTGRPVEAMEAYESAASIIEKLIEASGTNPADLPGYESDLAGIYMNVGVLQGNTGRPEEASRSFGKAMPIWRRIAQGSPDDVEAQNNLGGIYLNIGGLQADTGKSAEALTSLESALSIWRKLADAHPTVTDFQNSLAVAHMSIARLNEGEEAIEWQEKAAATWRKLTEDHPTIGDFHYNLAGVLTNMAGTQHNMATVMWANGDKAGALSLYEKARSNSEAALSEDGTNQLAQRNLANHNWDIGKLLKETGKPAEALESFERALAIRKKFASEHPDDAGSLKILADYHNGVGLLEQSLGKPTEAMASFEQCRLIGERLTSIDPASPDFACCLSGALSNMAELDIDAKRFEEAHARLRQAITLQKQAMATAPMHPTCRRYLAIHLELLAKVASERGQAEEAADAQRDLDQLKASDPR